MAVRERELRNNIDQDRALQRSEINPPKEVSITDAIMDADIKVCFYFLDKIKLLPTHNAHAEDVAFASSFDAAMKDALRKQYIELYNINKEYIMPFVTSGLILQIYYLSTSLQISQEQAQLIAAAQLQLIFVCAYGPDKLSIKKLKTEIGEFARMTDAEFSEKLAFFNITSLAQSAYITFKNNIVKAYQQYFKKADEHLAYAKRLMPDLTMDDFDLYRNQIAEQMQHNPQEKQARIVLEMMRLHALYPQYQEFILPLMLAQCKPQPIIIGEKNFDLNGHNIKLPVVDEDNMTQPIRLPDVAQQLNEEGLQPTYIQATLLLTNPQMPVPVREQTESDSKSKVELLDEDEAEEEQAEEEEFEKDQAAEDNSDLHKEEMERVDTPKEKTEMMLPQQLDNQIIVALPTAAQQRSFENTVEIFLNAEQITKEFENYSSSPQYINKQEKLTAAAKVDNILHNATTVSDYNVAFNLMAPYINRHKNLLIDMIFGNKNTDTWKKVMKQIREPATTALLTEVSGLETIDAKIKRLQEACQMPLFNEHRNNHWYTGKFGDTHAVSVIKKEISILEGQRNRPVLAPA